MYVCSARRRKGRAICANDLHLPIVETEAAILATVERDLLDADILRDALDLAAERLSRETPQAAQVAARDRLTREIGNLVDALAAKLADWKRLLRSRPTHGQTVLKTLLDGPIRVGKATAEGVPWEARGSVRTLLGTLSTCLASPIWASWNQLDGWLRAVDGLRHAA